MNEPDSFIYNFIFDLGKFYPFEISLLGGRFFATFSDKAPIVNDQYITDYKIFLQERLNIANTLIQIGSSESNKFIEWIICFIEFELINTEYRELQKRFLTPNSQKSFSVMLFYVFFDIFLFESINIDKKIQSFLSRQTILHQYFKNILESITFLPFTSLLELDYISSNIAAYYIYFEENLSHLHINLQDTSDYIVQKNANIKLFESINSELSKLLVNLTFSEVNLNARKEIFFKTIEYSLPGTTTITESNLDQLIVFKDKLISDFSIQINQNLNKDYLLSELLKISKTTKIPSNMINDQLHNIYDELVNDFILQFNLNEKIPFHSELEDNFHTSIGLSNIFISSTKTKRGIPSKVLVSTSSSYLGHLYYTIVTDILPSYYINEKNESLSYVYSILKVPESEKAIKSFFAYLFLHLGTSNLPEITASFLYNLIVLCELAIIDLQLSLNMDFDRNAILQLIKAKISCSDIESEFFFEKLVLLPGSSYLSFFLFYSLVEFFNSVSQKVSLSESLNNILNLLSDNFGTPLKLFLKNLEKTSQKIF